MSSMSSIFSVGYRKVPDAFHISPTRGLSLISPTRNKNVLENRPQIGTTKNSYKGINDDAEHVSSVHNIVDDDIYNKIIKNDNDVAAEISASQSIHDSLQNLFELTVSSSSLSQKRKEAIIELVLSLQAFVDGIENQAIGQENEGPIFVQVVRAIESIHDLITYRSTDSAIEIERDQSRNHFFHDSSVNLSPSISTRSFYDECIAARMPFPTKTTENTDDSDSEYEDEI